MKENNAAENKLEIEQEKSMYSICFSALVISSFFLLFLGFSNQGSITGAVVYGQNSGNLSSFDENLTIGYENASFENITQEIALSAILQAENDMVEMQEKEFGIMWVNDTLIEAKKYFRGGNYTAILNDIEKISNPEKRESAKALLIEAQQKIGVSVDYKKVIEKTKAISERKKKAYELKDSIRAHELRIQDFRQQGIEAKGAEELIFNAAGEFKNERYESAELMLKDAGAKLIAISAEATIINTIYKAGKDNAVNFVKKYYAEMLMLAGSALVIIILLYNRIMMSVLRLRIRDMGIEKDVLSDLMKKAQMQYFVDGNITKQTFEIKVLRYKEKLAEIRQKLPVVQSLLDKRLKSKRVL